MREVSGLVGSNPDEHARRIGRRMTLQALTWRTLGSSGQKPLGLDQLAAFMTLRQVHLSTVADGDGATLNSTQSELAEQLVALGIVGLMAHALVMRRSESEEIRAHLWARAAELAFASDFGEWLEVELCLAAISCCHSFHSIPTPEIVERLVGAEGSAGPDSLFGRRLAGLDDEARHDMAMWLLNTARTGRASPAGVEALVAKTKAIWDHAEDEATRDEIQQVIDLFEYEQDGGEDGLPAVTDILARWEHRRDGLHYAWMLHLLMQQPGTGVEAPEAAAEYLRLHPDPKGLGPVVLAFDLASHARLDEWSVSEECYEAAVEYLDRYHPSQEGNLNIEMNLEVLALLIRRSVGERDSHMEKLERWETARQERDSLKKLPDLAQAGRFFLVFWHYYETLCVFGLPTEPEVDIDEVRFGDESRVLAEWRAQGELVPEALVSGPSGTCFSADFLRYGRALFGSAAENAELEDARGMFNDRAHDALPALFDRLRSLSSLPDSISTLLTDHRNQLLRGMASTS